MAYIPNPDTQPGKKGGKNVTAIENQQTYSRDLSKVTGRVDAYGFESSQNIAFGEKTTGVLGSAEASALELARLPGRSAALDVEASAPSSTVCAPATFSLTPGAYTGTQKISINTVTVGASIHYTTDGSTPSTTNGTAYSGLVSVTAGTTTLKAIVYKTGLDNSAITSGVYVIS